MSVPLKRGPSETYSFQPASQCVPSSVVGPFRTVALRAIEAREMTAGRERRPDDAVAVDVDAARIDAGLGHLVHFGDAGFGRIVAAVHPHDVARKLLLDAPHTEPSTGLGITEYRL